MAHKPAQKVWVNNGGADLVGFFHDEYEDEEGKTKAHIQIGDTVHGGFAYREPGDREGHGPGKTYWNV